MDIKEWCEQNKKPGQKFRNLSDRKRFVKECGLKLVRDPKTGEDCVPVHQGTQMLTGTRFTAKRSKEETHEDRGAAKESFRKQRKSIDEVKTNKKAGRGQVASGKRSVELCKSRHERVQFSINLQSSCVTPLKFQEQRHLNQVAYHLVTLSVYLQKLIRFNFQLRCQTLQNFIPVYPSLVINYGPWTIL